MLITYNGGYSCHIVIVFLFEILLLRDRVLHRDLVMESTFISNPWVANRHVPCAGSAWDCTAGCWADRSGFSRMLELFYLVTAWTFRTPAAVPQAPPARAGPSGRDAVFPDPISSWHTSQCYSHSQQPRFVQDVSVCENGLAGKHFHAWLKLIKCIVFAQWREVKVCVFLVALQFWGDNCKIISRLPQNKPRYTLTF